MRCYYRVLFLYHFSDFTSYHLRAKQSLHPYHPVELLLLMNLLGGFFCLVFSFKCKFLLKCVDKQFTDLTKPFTVRH